MFETFSQNNMMLDTQFFMMKYGVFIVAGILGSLATIGNTKDNKYDSVKAFAKHLIMTIVLAVVAGILLVHFWDLSLEVCFAIVVIISFFIKKLIEEVNEVLENSSEVVNSFVRKKVGLSDEDKKSKSTKEDEFTDE